MSPVIRCLLTMQLTFLKLFDFGVSKLLLLNPSIIYRRKLTQFENPQNECPAIEVVEGRGGGGAFNLHVLKGGHFCAALKPDKMMLTHLKFDFVYNLHKVGGLQAWGHKEAAFFTRIFWCIHFLFGHLAHLSRLHCS